MGHRCQWFGYIPENSRCVKYSTNWYQAREYRKRVIQAETFVVDIVLLNNVKVSDMTVTCVNEVMRNFDVLIGMDIISLGDFSVTNQRGITCMSFRVPSCHEIDYVKHLGKRFNSDYPAGVRGSNNMPGKKKKK